MIQTCERSMARTVRAALLGFLVIVTATRPASGQGTGTIQGHVRDKAGKRISVARIVIVGSTLATTADTSGAYRLRSVPVGTHTLRAASIGYRSAEVKGVEVVAGQTVTADITLDAASPEVGEITVVAGANRLIPRDQVTSKQLVPQDRIANVLAMQPGTNSFEDASIVTGGAVSEFGGSHGSGIGIVPAARSVQEPCRAPYQCSRNTDAYDRIVDNPFLAALRNPLSTFAADVDRASYGNIRAQLTWGHVPPKDAVRIEELINYFGYDYPEPEPGATHPFTVTTEVTAAPWNRAHQLVRIGLQTRKVATRDLPPSNLVFLVDVSGSMNSPEKLPLVQASLRLLTRQLREQDRIAMVVYAGAAGLVLEPTSGAEQARILEAIGRLQAGGSTAGGAGIALAYKVAKEHFLEGGNNRVILATDGDFNVGASSDAEMERLIEQERRHGVFLTVLGFGMGNYKDSKLEKLADKGNGNYGFIDSPLEANKMLVQEMAGTMLAVAKDVKLQVEFNPRWVLGYRLIGYENRALRAEDFNDDRKDAGEMGAGHSVTALYEIVPTGFRSDVAIRGIDSLRYQQAAVPDAARGGDELLFVKVRYKAPDGNTSKLLTHPVANRVVAPSTDLLFTAAVAEFGMLLRDSEYKGASSLDDVRSLARRGLGADPHGYRAGFLELVETYGRLTAKDRPKEMPVGR